MVNRSDMKKWLKGHAHYIDDDYDDNEDDYDEYGEEGEGEGEGEEEYEYGKERLKKNVKAKKEDNIETEEKKKALAHRKKKESTKIKKEINHITLKKEADKKCIMLGTLNVLVLGHIDAGKSTLIGALLYNLNYVSEQVIKKYEKVRESCKYTYILDEEEDERHRNITLFNKRKEFFTYYTKQDMIRAYNMLQSKKEKNDSGKKIGKKENFTNTKKKNENGEEKEKEKEKSEDEKEKEYEDKHVYLDKNIFDKFYKENKIHDDIICIRKINIFDTPGHTELVNNLYSWSFFADCAILLVDAHNIYNKKNDETYKDVSILKSVGISNVIVVVNKMDLFNYDREVFQQVCTTVKSFFDCNKTDSIFEFLLNNNLYIQKRNVTTGNNNNNQINTHNNNQINSHNNNQINSHNNNNNISENVIKKTNNTITCEDNMNGINGRMKDIDRCKRKIHFLPVSAYKNKNVVKFEISEIPLFNEHLSLYEEIKYINLKKDLFLFKLCEELIYEKKNVLNDYYNFSQDNKLYSNNIFYNNNNNNQNVSQETNNPKWNDEENGFVGVVHDYTESNNTIKASVKIICGNLKIKNDFTLLPFNEKMNLKKVGTDDVFCKYINIDHLYYYLSKVKDFNAIKNIISNTNGYTNKTIIKEKGKHGGNANNIITSDTAFMKSFEENDFSYAIEILSKLVKYFAPTENMIFIKNDIIDNLIIDVADSNVRNGCVIVDSPVKAQHTENSKNGKSNILVNINNVFVFDKIKVLIKMNEIKIPTIIGRQYLLYSLNYTHSVTVTNIICAYEETDSHSFNSSNVKNGKKGIIKNEKNISPICNPNNYKKINNIFYKKVETKKCLRSYDIGIIEVEVNNNGLLCIQKYNHDMNYYISFDNFYFTIFDFFTNNISPLSRFVLADSSQIIASGLILDEGTDKKS